ncbi:hypothetical protein NFI96_025499, partial [Prochilodus magdalenae]
PIPTTPTSPPVVNSNTSPNYSKPNVTDHSIHFFILTPVLLLLLGLGGVIYWRYRGCTLENSEQQRQNRQTLPITAHTGGSVLLPCSCTDPQTKPKQLRWRRPKGDTWVEMSFNSDQYRNRVQLFNDSSPGNLSLLISHLTEEDEGDYECTVEVSHVTIRLTVKDTDHSIHFFILIPVLLLLLGLGGVIYWKSRGWRQEQTESQEQRGMKKDEQKTQGCQFLPDAPQNRYFLSLRLEVCEGCCGEAAG